MTNLARNMSVPVDLTNPGQFFACCGLLELAGRVDENALGWFCDQRFWVRVSAEDILSQFFECIVQVEPVDATGSEAQDEDDDGGAKANPNRGRILPMRLMEPFNLLLDWWNDDEAQAQKLKTWTAGQHVTDLLIGDKRKENGDEAKTVIRIPSMRDHFARVVDSYPSDWLRTSLPIEAPSAFSYDSRLSRNNALDLGHTHCGILKFSPAVDVLTLIGLQRFRPLMIEQWSRNQYCTWREPLPIQVAPVVVLGFIPHLIDACFEFPIKRRDSQGRFKLFGHAQPVRRPHVR